VCFFVYCIMNVYFQYAGNQTIPLTADISTTGILVNSLRSVQIQFLNISGTDGTPLYTLESSLDDITYIPYIVSDPDFIDMDITKGIRILTFKAQYIRINISMNGNTTGSCEIKLIGE